MTITVLNFGCLWFDFQSIWKYLGLLESKWSFFWLSAVIGEIYLDWLLDESLGSLYLILRLLNKVVTLLKKCKHLEYFQIAKRSSKLKHKVSKNINIKLKRWIEWKSMNNKISERIKFDYSISVVLLFERSLLVNADILSLICL